MTKIIELSSEGEELVFKKDFEQVSITAERDITLNFKSYCYALATTIKTIIDDYASYNIKDLYYKLVVFTDEVGNNNVNNERVYLFINRENYNERVINSITELLKEYNVNIFVCEEKPEKTKATSFYKFVEKWANEIQRFLTNEFDFKGITKINASRILDNNFISSFDIIISGKGTNDKIVKGAKLLSEFILNNKSGELLNDDYIFTCIKKYFKES